MKKIVFIINILIIICINISSFAVDLEKHSIEVNCNKTQIKTGEELEISINLLDVNNSLYVYSGEIEYNKELFENITNTSFTTANSWNNVQYNEENGKFIITNNNGSNGNEEILKIKMICKNNIEDIDTQILIKNLKTVNAEENEEIITLNTEKVDINIKYTTDNDNKVENEIKESNKQNEQNILDEQDQLNILDEEKQQNETNILDEIKESDKQNEQNILNEQDENIINVTYPKTGDNSYILVGAILITLIITICILIKYKKISKTFFIVLLGFTIINSIYANTIKATSNNIKKGDIDLNGEVNNKDIETLEKYLIDLIKLSNVQMNNSDVYEDNIINLLDLHNLIKKIKVDDNKDNENQNKGELSEENEITIKDTSFLGYNFKQIVPIDNKVTYDPLLITSEKMKEYGTTGAGSQWPVSLENSRDGNLMLYGIDVAGLFKSTDHGKTWVRANSGITSNGVGMFAIDPHNIDHVAALGLNTDSNVGGIHISYDQAESWNKTFKIGTSGYRYLWDGLEFDPTSYDSEQKYSTDLYFSIPYKRDTNIRKSTTEAILLTKLTEDKVGLYKSEDCGETFSLIINDKKLADGIIKFTSDGKLYIGNQYGLFLVNTIENKIEKTYFENDPNLDSSKGVTGLDVVENTLYVQTWDGIFTLENDTLTKLTNETYKSTKWPQFLEVSQSNPNHMIYQYRGNINNYYSTMVHVTFDGGKTWEKANADMESTFHNETFSSREKVFIIDPSDDSNVLTFGGDTVLRSSDGGLNFIQANGISNMMQGGKFQFNYYDPNLILLSAQDYTGAISLDGGKTFSKIKMDKGNFYNGFAADKDTIFGFASKNWGGGTLTYTHDGGDTWIDTGLTAGEGKSSTYCSSLQSINNPNVLFAGKYYSKDRGYTWKKMNGCISVFAYNYIEKKELYGTNQEGNIVVSYDDGDTWKLVSNTKFNKASTSEQIYDLAYDHINNCAYAIVRETYSSWGIEKVYKYDINTNTSKLLDIPRDTERGFMRLKTIEVDPNSTSVIYIGGAGDYFSSSTGLIRSIDGGKTWRVLTTANNPKYEAWANNQGGYEVSCINVEPQTGVVWMSSGCYGHSKINPPYNSEDIKHQEIKEHTIKYVYNGKIVNEVTIKNNYKHNYIYNEEGKSFVNWYTDKECTNPFPNESSVYNSMILYAKLDNSVKVKLYNGDTLFKEIDADKYDALDDSLIPKKDGYVFAGWYLDKKLTQEIDIVDIKENSNIYAGWYKIEKNIFNIENKDLANYIDHRNHTIQTRKYVTNEEKANNRCIYINNLEANTYYFITFKMDTRFRIGMSETTFWEYNPVPNFYIDEDDIDGKKSVNKYVRKVLESKNNKNLLIQYYSDTGTKSFMDIKKTFNIYKLESNILYF